MRVVYSEQYHIDIGTHVYPTVKYPLLHAVLVKKGGHEFIQPPPASWDELALVHTAEYLEQVREGVFSLQELLQLELPWSPEVVEGFRLMTGGTVAAGREAVLAGFGAHLGGGFHHGFANHGEGFCLFNDVAVAIRVLQREGRISRAAIVDCDVHHGNGTAMIFDRDPSVFTFSIHQQNNYPAFKPRSALDIGVKDGIGDADYLEELRKALPTVLAFTPDIVFYLAGADPYEDDKLGGLGLSKAGLRQRDRLVFEACHAAAVPVVLTLAGGYARRVDDTIAIHAATFGEAAAVFGTCAG